MLQRERRVRNLAGKRLRRPLILTLQGETVMDDADIYTHSLALRYSLRRGLRRAAVVTGCSQFVLRDAEARFGLAPGRGVVIPNGVELAEWAAPSAIELPFKRFVLGLGRFVEKKGFDLLLDAFAALAPRHPELGLLIGGDGPARAQLQDAAHATGLAGRVALPGALTRAHVAWAMENAAAFVLPSRVEPFGIVILEALRAGCPVIVSPHGGAREIVSDGVDGIVVDPTDTNALSAAIERVLRDPNEAERLSAAGRLRVAPLSWGTIAQRYREIYARLVG